MAGGPGSIVKTKPLQKENAVTDKEAPATEPEDDIPFEDLGTVPTTNADNEVAE